MRYLDADAVAALARHGRYRIGTGFAGGAGISMPHPAQPGADGEGLPLRDALAQMAAGEVEQLDVVVGQREDDLEAVHDVLVRAGAQPVQPVGHVGERADGGHLP